MSDALFLLSGGVKRDPAVDEWLFEQKDALTPIVRTWFARMRDCGPDVREVMHDGCPTACVGEAAFAYVAAFREHVNIGFFQGSALKDPARLLEGTGKRMRHVKVRPGEAFDENALGDLITGAYKDMRSRLATR